MLEYIQHVLVCDADKITSRQVHMLIWIRYQSEWLMSIKVMDKQYETVIYALAFLSYHITP